VKRKNRGKQGRDMKDREKGDTDKNLGKRKVEEKSRTKTRNDKKDEKR
jgi:hypothetical protein